jgi:hypothetical protein
MTATETKQFSSLPFTCDKIRASLENLSPVTEILDIKIRNQTMFSFELDSARISSGLKLLTAKAGTQVCITSTSRNLHLKFASPLNQVFQQQFYLNITKNEHLTAKKLVEIIVSNKEHARNAFSDETLLLNQRQLFTDIDLVVSSSTSCINKGDVLYFCTHL